MKYHQDNICEHLYSGRSWKCLHESNCAVIDLLTREFGHNKVYDGWRSQAGCIGFDKDANVSRIYDVLNMMLFGNALKKPSIECISQIEARKIFGNERVGQFQIDVQCLGANRIVQQLKPIQSTSKIALVIDEMKPPFMFVVDQLCHQMMHQFQFELGDGILSLLQAMSDGNVFDVHSGQFKQIMDKLNKDTGLLVEEDYGQLGVSFIETTYKARTMNDEYEGKEEIGLYDGFERIRDNYIEDELGTLPEDDDENLYTGSCCIANIAQDALQSSTPIKVVQKNATTIQLNIT